MFTYKDVIETIGLGISASAFVISLIFLGKLFA